MKIDHLLSFRKVAMTGSFTRAAQELFITQPTVTHHVQMLERELGYELLIRSSQETRLTQEGEALLRKVDELAAMLEDIKTIGRQHEAVHGELNIAASSVMGAYVLPRVLKEYAMTWSEVNIRLYYANSYTTATWVQDGLVNLGFAPWAPGFNSLSFTLLHKDHCILAASQEYCRSFAPQLACQDFSRCRFLFREKGTKVHDIAQDWLRTQPGHADRPLPIITGDMESIKNLALCGTGIAILPRCCVARELQFGLLKEIALSEQLPSIDYYLIQRKNDRLVRTASLLLQKALELIGAMPVKRGQRPQPSAGPCAGEPCYQSAPSAMGLT